jgi:hypothetical protein
MQNKAAGRDPAIDLESLRYQCCFCGLTIEPTVPDVASLRYTTCIDRTPDMQHDQELFCHTRCFRERLHPAVKVYALDLLELSIEERRKGA